jgi:hypothetical protein
LVFGVRQGLFYLRFAIHLRLQCHPTRAVAFVGTGRFLRL